MVFSVHQMLTISILLAFVLLAANAKQQVQDNDQIEVVEVIGPLRPSSLRSLSLMMASPVFQRLMSRAMETSVEEVSVERNMHLAPNKHERSLETTTVINVIATFPTTMVRNNLYRVDVPLHHRPSPIPASAANGLDNVVTPFKLSVVLPMSQHLAFYNVYTPSGVPIFPSWMAVPAGGTITLRSLSDVSPLSHFWLDVFAPQRSGLVIVIASADSLPSLQVALASGAVLSALPMNAFPTVMVPLSPLDLSVNTGAPSMPHTPATQTVAPYYPHYYYYHFRVFSPMLIVMLVMFAVMFICGLIRRCRDRHQHHHEEHVVVHHHHAEPDAIPMLQHGPAHYCFTIPPPPSPQQQQQQQQQQVPPPPTYSQLYPITYV